MAKVRVLSMALAVALAGSTSGVITRRAEAAEPAEPPIAAVGPERDYLQQLHRRLHQGWVDGYLRLSPYDVVGPSNSKRMAELTLTIRWDGTIDKVEVTTSSGSDDFDGAALNVVTQAGPFPPPVDVMADDGLVHLKWRFARNYRLCSGAEFVHVEYPLQIALPNLASRGHLDEAVRRMRAQLDHDGWTQDFLSPFVRLWLSRSNLSTELDARASVALALGGDRQQAKRVESMLLVAQTSALVAPALERLGVDVGARLAKALASGEGEIDRPAILATIRATPSVLAHCQTCTETLAAAVVDPRQPARARVEMINILGRIEGTEAVAQALSHAAKDPNPGVRGAALLAQLPPGRGRPGIIRMAALLHDPQPEIRAAAAAGVLRAGGDAGIEQLYLLSRDRDARPLVAAAAELGRMSSEESADLLRRLLKRPEKSVRVAVVTALAARKDTAARALVEPVLQAARTNAAEEVEIRRLAFAGASPTELTAMSADPRLGLTAYQALLDAQLRAEGARWLLTNLEQLSVEDRISAMGAWIAESPKVATTAQQ